MVILFVRPIISSIIDFCRPKDLWVLHPDPDKKEIVV